MQGAVGAQGFPAALEQGGVAAFQAQGCNLHQGIGAAFKNNADHADGAGNAVQVQARGQLPAQGGAADGVRQRAQRPQALHHGVELLLPKAQALHQGRGQPFLLGAPEILLVCLEDLRPVLQEGFRHGVQGSVALFQGAGGQFPGGGASLPGQGVQILHGHSSESFTGCVSAPLLYEKKQLIAMQWKMCYNQKPAENGVA